VSQVYFHFPSPPSSSVLTLHTPLSLSPLPSVFRLRPSPPLSAPSATIGDVTHRAPPADGYRQRPPSKNRPAERHPRHQITAATTNHWCRPPSSASAHHQQYRHPPFHLPPFSLNFSHAPFSRRHPLNDTTTGRFRPPPPYNSHRVEEGMYTWLYMKIRFFFISDLIA
jgi:hypothetical protein